MASYQLINAYLLGLRRRLAWRPDVDEVMAELEDHLLSSIEQLIEGGTGIESAQQLALDRFGDANTVATTFAATSGGGLAMPTTFTRRAGVAALVAAGLWAVFAATWLIEDFTNPSQQSFGGASRALNLLAMVSLMAAGALTAVLVIGLNRRHGGLGPLGAIGLVFVGLGVVASLVFWFVMGWSALFATGMLLVALAVRSRRLAPAAATAAFGAAWTVGALIWPLLHTLEVGTRDQWGNYPVATQTAIIAGVSILVPGLVGLGRWLSTETPVDVNSPEPMAAA